MSRMQKKFNEWFLYDENTGDLVWKKTKNSRGVEGTTVGAVDNSYHGSPRLVCKLDNKRHHIARVIWCMLYGDIEDGMYIDHINGDPLDNRLKNLRLTTPSGNSRNRKVSSANTSGVTGVVKNPSRGKPWRAQIWKDGTFCYLGQYDTKEEAVAARIGAEKALGYISHKRPFIRATDRSLLGSSHQ